MKKQIPVKYQIIDLLTFPFIYPIALLLKKMRKNGVNNFPLTHKILLHLGMFPIRDHYYEPLFHPRHIKKPLSEDRFLPGINWNIDEQLELLSAFKYSEELKDTPVTKTDELSFYMNNNSFKSGDAEFLYNLIRFKKPRRIIEVGSGNSTLMALKATRKNKEDPFYECDQLCIEPYEMPWLEKTEVKVMRSKIEDVDKSIFSNLSENDILFIDSSHIIRPQGDVLFEYLEILPTLNKGVIVHIHDIFSPKDYLSEWILEDTLFWNEQYLLEAFLSSNPNWKIIGALNFLHHHYYDFLKKQCPFLTPAREPGSFYLQKIT